MKTKVTYSQVKEALEAGFISPLNSNEKYEEFEYVGHISPDQPAQVKAPAFYVKLDGKSIVGGYKFAAVPDGVHETLSTGSKYLGRIVNGEFHLKKKLTDTKSVSLIARYKSFGKKKAS